MPLAGRESSAQSGPLATVLRRVSAARAHPALTESERNRLAPPDAAVSLYLNVQMRPRTPARVAASADDIALIHAVADFGAHQLTDGRVAVVRIAAHHVDALKGAFECGYPTAETMLADQDTLVRI